MYFETECEMAVHDHPWSLILVPIDNAYARNFLLVINSNLGSILPRFRDIVVFLLRRATSPLFHPNFAGGLDCQCCGSEERRA